MKGCVTLSPSQSSVPAERQDECIIFENKKEATQTVDFPEQHVSTYSHEGNRDTLETLALMILRTKHSHELAVSLFKRRQSLLVFYPLQIISLITALEGIVVTTSTGTGTNVLGFLLGVSGFASLLLNNLSKRWDFQSKAKSHEIMTRHMRWQLDEVEMIQNVDDTIGTTTFINDTMDEEKGSKSKIIADRIHDIKFFYQNELRMCEDFPPRRIEIAYEKLKSQLDIMLCPSSVFGSHILGKRCKDVSSLSDQSYYKILKLGYSELAIVLGDSQTGLGIALPDPDRAVKETMERISNMLKPHTVDSDSGYHAVAKLFPPRSKDSYLQSIKQRFP